MAQQRLESGSLVTVPENASLNGNSRWQSRRMTLEESIWDTLRDEVVVTEGAKAFIEDGILRGPVLEPVTQPIELKPGVPVHPEAPQEIPAPQKAA